MALSSHTIELTKRFYAWEERTRGYLTWPYPVSPEPLFLPFPGHYLPAQQVFTDDARKPTFLSFLSDKVRNVFRGKPTEERQEQDYPSEEELLPELYVPEGELCEFQIALPPDFECQKGFVDQFLQSLSYVRHPLSFEVIGTATQIVVQLTSRESDRSQVLSQLSAYVPRGTITEEERFLHALWQDDRNIHTAVYDFGLDQESMLPLECVQRFDIDPLIGIIGALSNCRESDVGVLQVLFSPARSDWAKNLQRSVLDWDGKPFFADAPELARSVQNKIEKPLYGVVIRVGGRSVTQDQANTLVKLLGSALTQFNAPGRNGLIPLTNEDYPDVIHSLDIVDRYTHRSGMLLNRDELVNFVHFPSASVKSDRLLRVRDRSKEAPDLAKSQGLILGHNRHHGQVKEVFLEVEQRMRHMYVIGASGTGKSTLLLNMVIQDLESGAGLAVLDPHGDLIDEILGFVPESRINDVVVFDPSCEDYPIAFNIFSAHSEAEKTLLASDLTGVFRRLSSSWGDQMNSVLANGILAMLESDRGGTLMTLRRFLIEKEFRAGFLPTVKDQEIVYYWEKEFPLLSGRPQAPVLTRLDTFLRPKPIRYMVAQQGNAIDFGQLMNEGKIFLAKLSHGGIGEENSYLLGALVVAKIHQLALSRQEMEKEKRRPFYLYIDEFQNFITPSMESILSGARKYNLGLILAHQELRQLASKNREVASSVIANPYTRVCFRMGDQDAVKLASGFSYFDAQDLQSLGIGEAIVRIERADYDFNLKTLPIPKKDGKKAEELRDEIVRRSREKYGTPRESVEDLLEKEGRAPTSTAKTGYPEEPVKEKKKQPLATPPQERPLKKDSAPERKPADPLAAVSTGRGGVQHRYLQGLIKRLGEERGYRAQVEKSILGGAGVVDVSLEKGDGKIACEITVTTSPEHELDNIQKCLAAGYEAVLVLSHEKGHLAKIRRLADESLDETAREKINYFLPEEFIAFLDQRRAQEQSKIKTVRGYKVKVSYKAVNESEQKQKRDAVSKLIVQSMKRLKEK